MGNITSNATIREDGARDLFTIGFSTNTQEAGAQNNLKEDLYFRESEVPLRQRCKANIVDGVRSLQQGKHIHPSMSSKEANGVSIKSHNKIALINPIKQKISQLSVKEQAPRISSRDQIDHEALGESLPEIKKKLKPGIGGGYSNMSSSLGSKVGFTCNHSRDREPKLGFRQSVDSLISNSSLIAPRTGTVSKSYSNPLVSTKGMMEESDSACDDSIHTIRELGLRKRESLPSLKRTSSSSPHSYRLIQKEVINQTMQERLMALRKTFKNTQLSEPQIDKTTKITNDDTQSHHPSRMTKERRNRRRAEHNQAIIDDLCDIVTDLFISEKTLFVDEEDEFQIEGSSNQQESTMKSVRQFLSDLPIRYALGVETPSEVLVHMRLVAAARSDDYHAAVHVVKLESAALPHRYYSSGRDIKLVTISCSDRLGLLEYITGKLLATGGSRVLDADVMTITENIVLDRFVVEMNGRLRLDKLKQCIEQYLRESESMHGDVQSITPLGCDDKGCIVPAIPPHSAHYSNGSDATCGQIYHPHPRANISKRESISEEVQLAVPLSEVVACANSNIRNISVCGKYLPTQLRRPALQRYNSAPVGSITASCQSSGESSGNSAAERCANGKKSVEYRNCAAANLAETERKYESGVSGIQRGLLDTLLQEERERVPNIPLDDLMLAENLGSGRISTVYRAIWQKRVNNQTEMLLQEVALKASLTDDPSSIVDNIAEFRREADIASSLDHFNICKIVGVVNDPDCFCIAYEYCEGGTLKNLLSDTLRCYEYLPIALDVANGMAYLHSRNVIHRDLKPANILLTEGNRAKIADFGMSVANTGQELTAETGTYRWMAPEVIRHESYSSNADVYSFGVVLWQLISREVPFTTLTPVQTAYAVAEGCRPEIPSSTPEQLRKIILACWDADTDRRPSFTYIAMALADYAKMAFSPANVGAQTVQIADEMLANVSGNSTVNVDFSVPMITPRRHPSTNNIGQRSDTNVRQRDDITASQSDSAFGQRLYLHQSSGSYSNSVGLPI